MKNTNANTLVIFGAPDHEEALAREIAEAAGCSTATATCNGKPVHAGNAYKATGYQLDTGSNELPGRIIIFECGDEAVPKNWREKGIDMVKCDHHNPGDSGYAKGPEDYFIGSSIGQLFYALDLPNEFWNDRPILPVMMTAAADHCPADAYAGRCPGVDPEEFAEFRLRQKAEFNLGKDASWEILDEEVNKIRKQIETAMTFLDAGKAFKTPIPTVTDVRQYGEVPELPEAALRTGQAYIARIPEVGRDRQPTGNKKIVIGGHTSEAQVLAFFAWARTLDNAMGKPYGNPTRGFGGVVVTDPYCPTCKGEYWGGTYNNCPHCGAGHPELG